jgi:hypothetical protein
MTGSTATFSTFNKQHYIMSRTWSITKKLSNLELKFEDGKSAFNHFLRNVDVIKVDAKVIKQAKKITTDYFTSQEGLEEMINPKFFYNRLQSSIGMNVNIYDKSTKDNLIAKGFLLQLISSKAEVQISERIDLKVRKSIQSFPTKQVALQ